MVGTEIEMFLLKRNRCQNCLAAYIDTVNRHPSSLSLSFNLQVVEETPLCVDHPSCSTLTSHGC